MPRRGRGPWYGYRVTAIERVREPVGESCGARSGRNEGARDDRHCEPRLALRQAPAIGVFGHYGNRNLGDEAIIEALIARLRGEWPNLQLRAFSSRPADTRSRHDVRAFPIRQGGEAELESEERLGGRTPASARTLKPSVGTRADFITSVSRWVPAGWLRRTLGRIVRGMQHGVREGPFLVRSYRRVRGLDALIIAGSNQFLDNFGGPWAFPYTLLKWSILCRLAGCRVLFVSVGAGPLDSRLSKAMLRACLPLADYVSFRDAGSRRLLFGDSASTSRPVYPDLAHSLKFDARPARSRLVRTTDRPVIGINPMPMYDDRYWCEPNRERYSAFVKQLAVFTHELVREGYPVFFFPTHPNDVHVASDVIEAMRPLSKDGDLRWPHIRRPQTTQELVSIIGEADIVVATRFHGILLGLHAWKPVLAICYYRKARELMRALHQEQYAVDLDHLDAEDLRRRFKALERRAPEERLRIQTIESTWRTLLEEQYTMLVRRFASLRQAA
jgi:polysaccharide pyruvyl transferase WcaK-like protein